MSETREETIKRLKAEVAKEAEEHFRQKREQADRQIFEETSKRKYAELAATSPELNPESPLFNKDKLTTAKAKQDQEIKDSIQKSQDALIEFLRLDIFDLTEIQLKESIKAPTERLFNALAYLYNINYAKEQTDILNQAIFDIKKEFELRHFLKDELTKPEYEGKKFNELSPELQKKAHDSALNAFVDTTSKNESADDPLQAAAIFQQLKSIGTPKYYTSPNTLLANELSDLIGKGALDYPVLNIGKASQVTAFVNVTLENMDGITIIGKNYSEYDRAVHDAAISLYLDRTRKGLPPIVTADMVYRTMTHKTADDKVSPQQKGAVTKSLVKLTSIIKVNADLTEELNRRGIKANGKPIEKFAVKDFLLPAKEITAQIGGRPVNAYFIKEKPPLLEYSELTGQQITVKGEMLDIREIDKTGAITSVSIPNNSSRIAIKAYLMRRIVTMQRDEKNAIDALQKYKKLCAKDKALPVKTISNFRKVSRIVLFDSIFENAEIEVSNSKTHARGYVLQVLDYWKAHGDIKSYKTRKKGKTIDAIIIEF